MATATRGSLGATRRFNLGALLRLLHQAGPLSRADLTRHTGLNRSTIAGMVSELAALGLVREEHPREPSGVGRPSPLVRVVEDPLVIVANPDIDAVSVASVGLNGQVCERRVETTTGPPSPAEAAEIIAALTADLGRSGTDNNRLLGIGIAVPGLVNRGRGEVAEAPHLGWRCEAFAERVTAATGLPARIANDASLATIAEANFGAGRGVNDFIYLNGSASGIGGGAIVAGQPLYGAAGYAGELGHQIVNPAGRPCHCGRIGCLQTEVDRARLMAAAGLPPGDAHLLADRIAAASTGALASEVQRQVRWLALGIANGMLLLNPERVILGGFLSALHQAADQALTTLVRQATFPAVTEHATITAAALGADLLAIGAAELWIEALLEDPAGIASRSLATWRT
jgi:predicted NBD/HSP70 family sugar kinase